MIDFKHFYNYEDDECTSIWLGCDLSGNTDLIRKYFYDIEYDMLSSRLPHMGLGEVFEFAEPDEEFLYFKSYELTNDIDRIISYLPSCLKKPKELFKRRFGDKMEKKFNYAIIAPKMRYDGHIKGIISEKYGDVVFLGVTKGF